MCKYLRITAVVAGLLIAVASPTHARMNPPSTITEPASEKHVAMVRKAGWCKVEKCRTIREIQFGALLIIQFGAEQECRTRRCLTLVAIDYPKGSAQKIEAAVMATNTVQRFDVIRGPYVRYALSTNQLLRWRVVRFYFESHHVVVE